MFYIVLGRRYRIEDVVAEVGLWPDGHPIAVVGKGPLFRLSTKKFAHYNKGVATRMADSQVDWMSALASPERAIHMVRDALEEVLALRRLNWQLKCFTSHSELTRAASRRLSPEQMVWNRRDAVGRIASRFYAETGRHISDAWNTRDMAGEYRAGAARSSLICEFGEMAYGDNGGALLIRHPFRAAFRNGLWAAIPIGPRTLGWAML